MIGAVMGGPVPAGVVGALGALGLGIGPGIFGGSLSPSDLNYNAKIAAQNLQVPQQQVMTITPTLPPQDLYSGWEEATTVTPPPDIGPQAGGYVGGDPETGGGPVDPPLVPEVVVTDPKYEPPPPVFQINPNQVINDIAMNAIWGGPYQSPQINPFAVYGSEYTPPVDWSGFFNTFGGK